YGSCASTVKNGVIQSVPDVLRAALQLMLHAISARCPASPSSVHRTLAAIERCSASSAGVAMPYQRSSALAAQANVRSRWHWLHAFGRPVSMLSRTLGLVTRWQRMPFSNPYVVYGMWQFMHAAPVEPLA